MRAMGISSLVSLMHSAVKQRYFNNPGFRDCIWGDGMLTRHESDFFTRVWEMDCSELEAAGSASTTQVETISQAIAETTILGQIGREKGQPLDAQLLQYVIQFNGAACIIIVASRQTTTTLSSAVKCLSNKTARSPRTPIRDLQDLGYVTSHPRGISVTAEISRNNHSRHRLTTIAGQDKPRNPSHPSRCEASRASLCRLRYDGCHVH